MADMDNIYNQDNIVTGVEPAKKRKGAVIGGITAGAVAVVAGGSAIAYNVSDFVKNQVKLTVSKPANYYSWVNEKNSNEVASQLSESYRKVIEQQKKGASSNMSLKFDLSDEATSLLDETLADTGIKSIESIAINANALVNGTKENINLSALINDESLLAIDMAADISTYDIFFRIAGLSDQWMTASAELDETADTEALTDLESILSPEELESLVIKYTDLYNSYIKDVELEKKEEVTIGDIKVEYTVAQVELNEEKADEIAEGFLNAFKEDEVIKSIVVDRTKAATEEEFNTGIDEAIAELKEETSVENALILKTYIDPKGEIRGFSANNKDNENDNVRFILGKEDSEIRGEFVATEEAGEAFRADIALTENDKTYNGTVDINAEGEEVSVKIDNVTITDEEKGLMNGNISLTVADQTYSLNLTAGENSQSVSTDIVVEDVNYGKLIVDISSENGAEVTMPEKDSAFDINGEDVVFPTDYVAQEDMTSFIKDILTKLGFEDEYADEMAQTASDSLYGVYNYDDLYYEDDFYEDDFNDWDEDDIIGGADYESDLWLDDSEWDDSEFEFDESDWEDVEFDESDLDADFSF